MNTHLIGTRGTLQAYYSENLLSQGSQYHQLCFPEILRGIAVGRRWLESLRREAAYVGQHWVASMICE